MIGGSGEHRTLRTAARWADHWDAGILEPDEWHHKVSVLEQHCGDIGRNPDEIEKSMMVWFSPDDMAALEERFRVLADIGVDEAIFNFPSPTIPNLCPGSPR